MAYQLPAGTQTRPIAVIGAGTLGSRIALMMAVQGAEVRIHDSNADARERGAAFATAHLVEQVAPTGGDCAAGSDRHQAVSNNHSDQGRL